MKQYASINCPYTILHKPFILYNGYKLKLLMPVYQPDNFNKVDVLIFLNIWKSGYLPFPCPKSHEK